MPWIKYQPRLDTPAHYELPRSLPDAVVLGHSHILERAKQERKSAGLTREGLIAVKKEVGKTDRDLARQLSEEASYWLKVYRGWDFVIGWLESENTNWRNEKAQEEIAPFIDRAFNFLDLLCV